jgi:hypothetical protein
MSRGLNPYVALAAAVGVALAGSNSLSGGARAQDVPIVSPRFGAPPAPSELTIRFLAVGRPTAAFLARSSFLAQTQASARWRGFARREASEQAAALRKLAEAAAPVVVTQDPLDVAAAASSAVDARTETVLAGLPRLLRTPGAQSVAADLAIAQHAAQDLAALSGSEGRAFDVLYLEAQREGLLRLIELYKTYVQNGDDLHLRAFAVHELPRVRARLAVLGRA